MQPNEWNLVFMISGEKKGGKPLTPATVEFGKGQMYAALSLLAENLSISQ